MRRHTRQADTAQMLLNVIHLIVGEVVSLTWRSQQHIRLRENKQVNNHPTKLTLIIVVRAIPCIRPR